MHQALKAFLLAVCLLVAAFFANFFGFVSIPWLDINDVATYGGEAKAKDAAMKKALGMDDTGQTEQSD